MNKNRRTQKGVLKKIYLYIYLFLSAIIMNVTKMEKWLKCLVYNLIISYKNNTKKQLKL